MQRQGARPRGLAGEPDPRSPPTAAFTAPPGPAPGPVAVGSAGGVRLPWRTADDYGVASLQAELRLRDRPDAEPLILPIPLDGTPRSARGTLTQDLTSHPWAGLDVVVRLVAKDAIGQAGRSDEAGMLLPERAFRNPVAAAVVAVRKALSLHPEDRAEGADALDALAAKPDAFDKSRTVFLNMESAAGLLRHGRAPDTLAEAQARLWTLALAIEEGDAERTEKALAAAERALQDALEKQSPQDKDAQAELDKEIRAFEEALRKHLQALAEQAKRNGVKPMDPQAQSLTNRELERMMQQMRDAAREGRLDEAKQRLAQLEQMLQQMQAARPGSRTRSARRANRSSGRAASRWARCRTWSSARAACSTARSNVRRPPIRSASPVKRHAQHAPGSAKDGKDQDRAADASSQQALRLALGELMQQFGDLTGKVPEPLSDADVAMRGAAQALGSGQDAVAQAAERKAIEALQRGSKSMSQQMAAMGIQVAPGSGQEGQDGDQGDQGDNPTGQDTMRDGQRQGGSGQAGQRARRDPLGRPVDQDAEGNLEGGDVQVPDEIKAGRARAIQDELRRRDAERSRPQPELDYFQRLLKPF